MELRQLEYFLAVAEEENFTRAAERVHISQSGVSAQIRQLEKDLGAELFDRSARTATLTAAGTALLAHARQALSASEAGRQAVGEITGLIRGRLLIGMPAACTVTGLFDGLAAYHLAHPGVEITVVEDSSDHHVARVRAGTMDLALVGIGGGPPDGVESMVIVSERLAVLYPPGHPLGALPELHLADLLDHPLICMPRGTGIRTVFDRCCTAAGLSPAVAVQAAAPTTVADLAIRGLGVGIMSESMTAEHREDLDSALIADATVPAVLALIWKPGSNPALRELVSHMRLAFGR